MCRDFRSHRRDIHGKFASLRPVIIVARARNRGKRRETAYRNYEVSVSRRLGRLPSNRHRAGRTHRRKFDSQDRFRMPSGVGACASRTRRHRDNRRASERTRPALRLQGDRFCAIFKYRSCNHFGPLNADERVAPARQFNSSIGSHWF